MTINGRRDFRFNGRKYHVMNVSKRDQKSADDKYYLCEVDSENRYRVLVNRYGLDVPKFGTIKEAQRYVRNWDFLLITFC